MEDRMHAGTLWILTLMLLGLSGYVYYEEFRQ